ALAAGTGAVFLVKRYLDEQARRQPAANAAVVPVVVAAQDLAIGTALTENVLGVIRWPSDAVPAGTFGVPKALLGRTLRRSIAKGEPVLEARLASKEAGQGLAAVLARGMRAMAVKVDQVIGVAGFVQPGDFVDVITTMTPDEEARHERRAAKISKIILQNIKVLAVGEQLVSQGAKPVTVQVVTLEVSPDQSERLALASRHGEIQLTMRSGIDTDPVATAGVTPVALLTPDDGTAPASKPEAPQPVAAARKPSSGRKKPATSSDVKPKSDQPVVEILRGDRVEERKLRPSADSKRGQ
ncbi:MAG: Flp pilus assembly protein CpaB, partial [Deltaproteobacteria bacterium]|nr:Flp pilus assembly protein CpaB [Deltaproteobacteria bacterium]